MENIGGLEFKDTITKQDLIDYAVAKKVEEISNLKEKVDKKYKTKSAERDVVRKEIEKVKKESVSNFINDNYGEVIKLLEEKQGTKHVLVTSSSDLSGMGEIGFMLNDMAYDHVIIYVPNSNDKKKIGRRHGGWGDFLGILDGTIISIEKSKIKYNIEELEAKFKELDEECKDIDRKRRIYDDKIYKVRNQKEAIKATIIEQALLTSEDGVKMLESLKNIDFGIGDIKMIK